MTDILKRDFAPLTEDAWSEIEETAKSVMSPYLTARSIVDFSGPHGWDYAAVNLGRIDVRKPVDTVTWGLRKVMPLIEVRVPFTLNQFELDDISRGSEDADLAPLEKAARETAQFEDRAIFRGFADGGITGMVEASEHTSIPLGKSPSEYPNAIAKGIETLQLAGVGGPYALVLNPDRYFELLHTTAQGYPISKVVRNLVGESLVWSRAVENGLLVSTRGGDFELVVGQDLSIGYASHDKDSVELYLTESFAFRINGPEAALEFS